MGYVLAMFLGLAVGSFLNVCIYRLPRGESVVFPPSHCTSCGQRLASVDLVPVLSYLWLGGRCRYCGSRISPQYPLVELGTAVLYTFLYQAYGSSPELVGRLVLASGLIVAAAVDLRHCRIPNQVVIFLAVAGLLVNSWTRELPWWQVAAGGAVGAGILGALAVLSRGGMGEGDIKLAAATGLYLGPVSQLLAVLLAAALGSAVGGLLIASGRRGRRDPIPFAPFLGVGSLVTYIWGADLWRLYLAWVGLR